jgi:hypothetical protein
MLMMLHLLLKPLHTLLTQTDRGPAAVMLEAGGLKQAAAANSTGSLSSAAISSNALPATASLVNLDR